MMTESAFSTLSNRQVEFLDALSTEDVDFVVIGGYAMRFHGLHRKAKDLDLLVGYDRPNASKLLSILTRLGEVDETEGAEKLTRPKVQVRWFDVELLTSIEGIEFNEVKARASEASLDNFTLPVASVSDLLASKRAAARSDDEDDIKFLENLAKTV